MEELTKLSEYLDIFNEAINPGNFPLKEFYHYSIPRFKFNKEPLLQFGEEIKSNKKIMCENCILVSKLNPYILRVWPIKQCQKNSICSSEFVVLKFKDKQYESLQIFFSSLLNSIKFKKYLLSLVTGTSNSHQRVRPYEILNFEFKKMSFFEMNRIGSLFSKIQKKKEINLEILSLLERIGELSFKKIFKEDGSKINLAELIEISKGVSYRSEDLKNSETGMISLKSFSLNGGLNLDGAKGYIGEFKEEQIIHSGEIIVANTDITQNADIIGKPIITYGDINYKKLINSLDVSIIRPKDEKVSLLFLYFLLKNSDFQNKIKGYVNGTTVLHLNTKGIRNYEFSLPSKKEMDEFNKIGTFLYNLYLNLNIQNQILSHLEESLNRKYFL